MIKDLVKMDVGLMSFGRQRTRHGINHRSPFGSSPEKQIKRTCNGEPLGIHGRTVPEVDIPVQRIMRTYKRRKCNGTRIQSIPPSDGNISKASSQCTDQSANGKHSMVLHNDANGQDVLPQIDIPVLMDGENDVLHEHWTKVHENMSQSMDGSNGGIQGCIQDTLASGTFRATGSFERQAFSRQTVQAKDVVNSGQELNGDKPHQAWKETKNSQNAAKERNRSRKESRDKADVCGSSLITERCQRVFHYVMTSEKFVSLCSLLLGDLKGFVVDQNFKFPFINMRMKDGAYVEHPGHFAADMQQVGDWPLMVTGERKHELSNHDHSKEMYSSGLCTAKKPPSHELVQRTRTEQSAAHLSYKDCVCASCGAGVDDDRRLICDSCERMYHPYCIEPPLKQIPIQSWYCMFCSNGKLSPTLESLDNSAGNPCDSNEEISHHCVVCERLYNLKFQKPALDKGRNMSVAMIRYAAEGSDFHRVTEAVGKIPMEAENKRSGFLCKVCGSRVDDGREFVACRNSHCLAKYFHIQCLKSPPQDGSSLGWYCPSCLCRGCLVDKDDDVIVLCDDCDEGYHTYCMKPSRLYIPRGKWYCHSCEKKHSLGRVKNQEKLKSFTSIREEKLFVRRKKK